MSTPSISLRSAPNWRETPIELKPFEPWITRSPTNPRFTSSSIDEVADAPNTVMNANKATPIMSAPDVEAVRRGLRLAFSRATIGSAPRGERVGQNVADEVVALSSHIQNNTGIDVIPDISTDRKEQIT